MHVLVVSIFLFSVDPFLPFEAFVARCCCRSFSGGKCVEINVNRNGKLFIGFIDSAFSNGKSTRQHENVLMNMNVVYQTRIENDPQ